MLLALLQVMDFMSCFEGLSIADPDIKKVNKIWNKHYPDAPDTKTPKVTFSQSEDDIRFIQDDDDDSVRCRRGTWYYDGARFRERIRNIGSILSPILSPSHREAIYKKTISLFVDKD